MASRLRPFRWIASRAPASKSSRPRGLTVKPIQRFRAATVRPWARNRVPTVSPATIFERMPGVRPQAMTTFSPAAVASRAASSLLAIPPLPTPPARSRTRSKIESVEPLHGGNQPAAAERRVAVVQPVDVGKQHQQGGPQQVRHNGRQAVVIAKGGLQFIHADGVVFVDDGEAPNSRRVTRVFRALR